MRFTSSASIWLDVGGAAAGPPAAVVVNPPFQRDRRDAECGQIEQPKRFELQLRRPRSDDAGRARAGRDAVRADPFDRVDERGVIAHIRKPGDKRPMLDGIREVFGQRLLLSVDLAGVDRRHAEERGRGHADRIFVELEAIERGLQRWIALEDRIGDVGLQAVQHDDEDVARPRELEERRLVRCDRCSGRHVARREDERGGRSGQTKIQGHHQHHRRPAPGPNRERDEAGGGRDGWQLPQPEPRRDSHRRTLAVEDRHATDEEHPVRPPDQPDSAKHATHAATDGLRCEADGEPEPPPAGPQRRQRQGQERACI